MRIRMGFVSNSSSSSFVLNLYAIEDKTIRDLIKSKVLNEYQTSGGMEEFEGYDPSPMNDFWTFREIDDYIVEGFTSMDNGNLGDYLNKIYADIFGEEDYKTWILKTVCFID